MRKENIFKTMETDILNSNLDEGKKNKILKNILNLKEQKVNVMITGATGSGKSSTINALFSANVSKVGEGVDPETMDIQKYDLDNLTLWDTPGLGDGKATDNKHAKNIINKLNEKDKNGNALIDLVLVVLDGTSRDLGTSYELINNVIIPNLGENKKRILVAINQADMAMKGRNWNAEENKPNDKLTKFLEEKVESVKRRIFEGTGVEVEPIYYSAGYKDDEEEQRPYNLSKLLYYIVQNTPKEKRVVYVDNISKDQNMWQDNDEILDYNKEIRNSFFESITEGASVGSDIGGEIGSIFGRTGEAIGSAVGGFVGGVVGAVGGFVSSVASLFGW